MSESPKGLNLRLAVAKTSSGPQFEGLGQLLSKVPNIVGEVFWVEF